MVNHSTTNVREIHSYEKLLLYGMLLASLLSTNVYGATEAPEHSRSTQDTEQMKLGIKFKLHTASFLADELEYIRCESITRYSFDVFREYALNKAVGLQLSLGYSGQGVKFPEVWPRKRSEHYLHYVMLSVVPRFYQGSERQLCLFIGSRVSWLASARAQLFGGRTNLGEEVDLLGDKVPEAMKYKRVDWGVLFGLDYEFDAGLILGFDCNVGITNIFEDESKNFSNVSAGCTLGYNFTKLFNQ